MRRVFLIAFLVAIIATNAECRPEWFPKSLYESVANKTSQFTKYVRDVKNYYVDNVKRKITSYFGDNRRSFRTGGGEYVRTSTDANEQEFQAKKKFREYVEEAEKSETKIFDAIAPPVMEKQCLEDDPSVSMSTPQMIAMHGYPSESHTVKTSDGYILTLHRIPYSKNAIKKEAPRKTAFLHHGLLGSSADWVIPGPQKALAYILSDAGYDVWLANVRGNTYSRAHVTFNVESYEFWNFTWHEVSQHDLPAAIDFIMENKGWDVKINYIGHSMGTTVLFALLSTQTHYNKVLRAGFALAPVAYMTDIKSPIHYLAKFANNIEYLMKILGANEFLPQNSVLRWLSKHACELNHYEEVLCENSLFVLCGVDTKQFNDTLLPIILGHVPAGASTKSLIHYAQEIRNNGRFQQYDYGKEGNIRQYGMPEPPQYQLHKITLPIALLSAHNDWLASDTDVTTLYVQLSNPIEHYTVPLKEFNHIDFLWAIDAPKLVYKKLIELMEEGSEVFGNSIDVVSI